MTAAARTRIMGAMSKAPHSVTLQGGPMDGWVVKPDAPCLRADWYQTWPPFLAGTRLSRRLHAVGVHALCRWHPGHYVVKGIGATWEEYE